MKLVFGECGSKKATVRLTFDAGSSVEYGGAWTSGISHLAEHMMFQGTNNLSHSELTKSMATLGVDWNAATWHDKVSFFINVPAENVYEAASLLKDMLFNREFNSKLFDKEKLVVLEEERESSEDVDLNIIEDLDTHICKGPFAEPIIGTKDSIKAITLKELHDYHEFYFKPSRALLTITGPADIDYKAISDLFGKDTGRFSKSKKCKNLYTKRKVKHMYNEKLQQSRVFVSYKAVPIKSKDALVLNFLHKFLSEDMDSRLFQELRQTHGLCYGVGAHLAFYTDVGWYVIWTRTSHENVKKSIRLINQEINKLLIDGPAEEEIIRARNKYMSEIYSVIETSYGLNSMLANKAFYGLPTLEDSIKRIKNMNSRYVYSVFKKIFIPENRQVFTYSPVPEEEE